MAIIPQRPEVGTVHRNAHESARHVGGHVGPRHKDLDGALNGSPVRAGHLTAMGNAKEPKPQMPIVGLRR
eukprot:7829361-Pyramimonas_sp.AAC.1